jgi:hypothetical protein
MSIYYHEESGEFHLTNGKISYLMEIMENGQLEQLYYGRAVHDRESFHHFHEEAMRPLLAISVDEPGLLSMQYTRQEIIVCLHLQYSRKTGAVSVILYTGPMRYLPGKGG